MGAKDLVHFIATTLAEEPDAVEVSEGDGSNELRLRLSAEDVGRVIGRRGRTAKAIRTLLRAAGPYELEIGGDPEAEADETDAEEHAAETDAAENGAE